MKVTLQPVNWPPLVTERRGLPTLILVRDSVITVLAWGVMVFLVRDLIFLMVDYLEHPFFQLSDVAPPNIALMGSRLRPYAAAIAFFLVWLLVSVLVWRGKARGRRTRPPPDNLTVAEHAQAFGLESRAVEAWQQERVLVLILSPEGRIESAQGKTLEQP